MHTVSFYVQYEKSDLAGRKKIHKSGRGTDWVSSKGISPEITAIAIRQETKIKVFSL